MLSLASQITQEEPEENEDEFQHISTDEEDEEEKGADHDFKEEAKESMAKLKSELV